MGDMNIPTGQIPAVASTKLAYAANMSSEWPIKAVPFNKTNELSYNSAKTSIVYDSLGAKHSLGQYFVKTATGVDVHYTFDNADVTPVTSMTFDERQAGDRHRRHAVLPTRLAPQAGDRHRLHGHHSVSGEATTSTDRADAMLGTYTGVELADAAPSWRNTRTAKSKASA